VVIPVLHFSFYIFKDFPLNTLSRNGYELHLKAGNGETASHKVQQLDMNISNVFVPNKVWVLKKEHPLF